MTDVLVVGATGLVGGKVARLLMESGHHVRCLVREGTDATSLEQDGFQIVRGDITKPGTLPEALRDVRVIVTTAYGYSRRRKGDTLASVDDVGNRNLIDAAKAAGIERFIFTSILTADKAVSVPHFHQKALTESYLEASGVPFVSLRPGGFLDTLLGMNLKDLRKGRFRAMAASSALASTILSNDVASALATAVTKKGIEGLRIDLGMETPVTLRAIVEELSVVSGTSIQLVEIPPIVRAVMFRLAGIFNPFLRDIGASMDYVSSGQYVADTTLQTHFFGSPPTLRDSLHRWAREVNFGGQT